MTLRVMDARVMKSLTRAVTIMEGVRTGVRSRKVNPGAPVDLASPLLPTPRHVLTWMNAVTQACAAIGVRTLGGHTSVSVMLDINSALIINPVTVRTHGIYISEYILYV